MCQHAVPRATRPCVSDQLIPDWLILGLQSPRPQPSAAWYTAMMALLRPRLGGGGGGSSDPPTGLEDKFRYHSHGVRAGSARRGTGECSRRRGAMARCRTPAGCEGRRRSLLRPRCSARGAASVGTSYETAARGGLRYQRLPRDGGDGEHRRAAGTPPTPPWPHHSFHHTAEHAAKGERGVGAGGDRGLENECGVAPLAKSLNPQTIPGTRY